MAALTLAAEQACAQDTIRRVEDGYLVPGEMLVQMQNRIAEADSLERRVELLQQKERAWARDTTAKRQRIDDLVTLVARYDSLLDRSQELSGSSFWEDVQQGGIFVTLGYGACELANR